MSVFTDHNGLFLQGVDDPDILRKFIHHKFSEAELQYAYEHLLAGTKTYAKENGISPLKALWVLLERAYQKKAPPLTCQKGCDHCCHTGVSITQVEWENMVDSAQKKGLDLNLIIEKNSKSIARIEKTIKSGVDSEKVDWHRMVVNQPCPFLDEDNSCQIHDDRPLDCRLMVAFREVCASKNLEHAQRGVIIEEAVAPTVIAKIQHDKTPKIKRRKFDGTQKLKLIHHWLITWKKKKKK